MKKSLLYVSIVFFGLTAFGSSATSEFLEHRAAMGTPIKTGQWHAGLEECRAFAEKNGLPLVAIWSNGDNCPHCTKLENNLNAQPFREWMVDSGIVFHFAYSGDPGNEGSVNGTTYNWCWGPGKKLQWYPFCRFYWKKNGKVIVDKADIGDNFCNFWSKYLGNNERNPGEPMFRPGDSGTYNIGSRYCINYLTNGVTGVFKDYVPMPTYAGGYFTQTNYPYASLQAEPNTTFVGIEIVREATVATNQLLSVVFPDQVQQNVTLKWADGQLSQVYTNREVKAHYTEGKDVVVSLYDGSEVKSVVKIAYTNMPNSAANPKWIGESFAFGEWTMDLGAATNKVLQQSGDDVWTLVCIQGSQWCPDCGNVEKNFLDVKDAKGDNRFQSWATDNKKVALVTIDIPNFGDSKEGRVPSEEVPDIEGKYTACLLKREARHGSPDGEDHLRSGLGYLTRKMVSDADAKKVLDRNHDLVVKNTYEGGFHRPEDTNSYRTGAPIFVLLDKYGKVRARLTRMANASPKDAANFDNILKRFDEMIEIAKGNATEIENNAPTDSNRLELRANGDHQEASLSHVDQMDVFRLSGFEGNALQSLTVRGASSAEVVVSILSVGEGGSEQTVVSSGVKELNQDGGIKLESALNKGNYFVKIAVADITARHFKLESSESTRQEYSVDSSVIWIPQEDKATAFPPQGGDTVILRLQAKDESGNPLIYRMKGMGDGGCALLKPVDGHPGFFTATSDGDAEVKLDRTDGTLEYQVWNAGSVEFVASGRTVSESVCDEDGRPLNIPVRRIGGKSGRVMVTVSVDRENTSLDAAHFWLVNTNEQGNVELVWDDEIGEKVIQLYIDDTLMKGVYDGMKEVVLKAVSDSGEAGDVGFVPGKDIFKLIVTENDTQNPGKAFFVRTEPACARPWTVYARENEGAKIVATRTGGSDGLVAGVLLSSIRNPETKFVADDARDIEDLAKEFPDVAAVAAELENGKFLYWSNRELGEKRVTVSGIPAGRSARISFVPVGGLKGIAASNSVTVVSVASDAPGFSEEEKSIACYRNVESQTALELTGTRGGEVSFLKLSGTLPSGLKVAAIDGKMSISGSVTARAGTYSAVYQVREKREKTLVPGLVVRLTITVTDVVSAPKGLMPLNPAAAKSKTLKNIPVFNADRTRLEGTLQLALQPSGRLSAKFTGSRGTLSFSSRSWKSCSDLNGYALEADLQTVRHDGTMNVVVHSGGQIDIRFIDSWVNGCTAESDGKIWSKGKDCDASAWKGYYTAALEHKLVVSEDEEGLAPVGSGYVTLRMESVSACNSGTFQMAGMLPNGVKISGSCVLTHDGYLPIVKTSSKEFFSAAIALAANAVVATNRQCVTSLGDVTVCWMHQESATAKGSYEVRLACKGGFYNEKEDLGGCCAADYDQTDLVLYADGITKVVDVSVGKNSIEVDNDDNPYGVSRQFTRRTGVLSGYFVHPELKRRVSYSGVVVNGWGGCTACNPGEKPENRLPFVSGSYYFSAGSPRLTYGGDICIDTKVEK